MKIYAWRKRKINDIDILLREKDIYIFAERIKAKVKKRKIEKKNFHMNDLGFTKQFQGFGIEAVSKPEKNQDRHLKYFFDNKIKRIYLGQEVYLVPLEGIIVHKALMFRKKDKKDLEKLKKLNYNKKKINMLAGFWEKKKHIIRNLRKAGFDNVSL